MAVEDDVRVRPVVWWLGLGACLLVGVFASFLAYQNGLPSFVYEIDHVDKIIHCGMGAAFAFFLDPICKRREIAKTAIPLAAVRVLVPAGIEEYMQRYSPNRTSSIWDFLADVAGVALGIWISRRIDRVSRRS